MKSRRTIVRCYKFNVAIEMNIKFSTASCKLPIIKKKIFFTPYSQYIFPFILELFVRYITFVFNFEFIANPAVVMFARIGKSVVPTIVDTKGISNS